MDKDSSSSFEVDSGIGSMGSGGSSDIITPSHSSMDLNSFSENEMETESQGPGNLSNLATPMNRSIDFSMISDNELSNPRVEPANLQNTNISSDMSRGINLTTHENLGNQMYGTGYQSNPSRPLNTGMVINVVCSDNVGNEREWQVNLSNMNTIRDLKSHLAAKVKEGYGFEVLLYRDSLLEESMTITSCKFERNCKIYGTKNMIRIIVEIDASTNKVKPLEMEISSTLTTKALLQNISQRVALDTTNSYLTYNGQCLQDGRLLCQQKIRTGSHIRVGSRLRGGIVDDPD